MRHKVFAIAALCAFVVLCALPALVFAQANTTQANTQANITPSRITQAIDEANLTQLRGNTHPLAQARFDQGAAPDSLPMQRMLLVLKRSPTQESALDALLDQQQDSTSANFHQWLTPQQFGQQFGPSDQDIQTITDWLQSHGFTVAGVSNGRTVIEFSGTAGQVRQAFHTEIHRYTMNGQDHWANASDPQIPAALTPVVAGINTLYNFPRQAMHEIVGTFSRSRDTGKIEPVGSQFTITQGQNEYVAVAPADFAKIYSVPNLTVSPTPGGTQYNGDGQTIAIVGESEINPQDITQFRTLFGLPTTSALNIVVNGPDPGFNGAETEADLDVQWAGAVAPNATIDLILAEPTETSLGVDLAAQYAVDNNLAPVLNESFGICEFFMGTADNQFYNQLWQQASAEGITVTVSSGDAGAATCDQYAGTQGPAEYGRTVSGFTSTPYNVSVGGTDFNDVNDFSYFWNLQPSDTPKVATALGYIPEMTWNDSCTNQEIFDFFDVSTAEQSCNSSTEKSDGYVNIVGGSGGQSNCTTSDSQNESSCSGGYAKPSWQAGTGVPSDGKRDIPDVSLFASNGFNASFYVVCESDLNPNASSCDPFSPQTDFVAIGGTSASSPAFAAIMALVNQAMGPGSRQGNANYTLYKLAAQSGASCVSLADPLPSCVFYDIPSGSTISMPCVPGTPDQPNVSTCTIQNQGAVYTVGVLSGYPTGAGYDEATGLGSVNAASLISKWKTFNSSLKSSTTTLTLTPVSPATSLTSLIHGQSVQITVNVTGGSPTPTGTVALMANVGSGAAQSVGSATLSNGTATFSTMSLPGDPTGASSYTVFAQYSGDATYKTSSSTSQSVSVAPEASKISIAYELYNPQTGSITNPNATSAAFDTPGLLRVNITSQAGDACSTNGPPPPGNTGCPTGSVTITDNGTALDGGTFALNSQGYAEDQGIFLSGGTHDIAVTYNGDSSYTSCPQAIDTISISKAPTTITLNGPGSPQALGSPVSLSAIINTQIVAPPTGFSPSTMAGSVTFFAGGTPIVPGPNATIFYVVSTSFPSNTVELYAGLTISSLPAGTNTITAQYNGDQNYAPSALSSQQQFFVRMSTATSLSPSNLTIVAGTSVNFTATVTPTQSGIPAPTGTVTIVMPFDENGGRSTTATLVGDQAQGSLVMPAGTILVQAGYNGDTNNAPSTSANITENVTPISTSMTLTSSGSSSQVATPVVFTATLNSTPADGPPPGGTVNLTVGSLYVASGSVSNGQAVITTDGLPAGSDNVVATYVPDQYRSSSTASIQETVSKGSIPITVTSPTPTIVVGSFVVFVAQLQLVQDAPFPTAFVQFTANGTPFGNPLPIPINGQVIISTNSLPAGTVTIAANYPGDSNYNPSSGTFSESVSVQPSFTVSANPTSLAVGQPGQSAITTLTFTSQGNLTGTGGFASSTCGTSFSEEISCSITSFTLPANGTATATLTFTTTAPSSSLAPGTRYDRLVFGTHSMRLLVFSVLLFTIAFAFAARCKSQRWRIVFGALILAVVVSGISCGGGSGNSNTPSPNPGTPAGNVAPLSVSITINGVTQTVPNLTLTVN